MSSISGIGSINTSVMTMSSTRGMERPQRPDPSQLASDLFSQLDTSGQGYIEKSDLASALGATSGDSDSTSGVDDLFSALDGDSDGKVTEDELADVLTKLQEQLDQQFEDGRMQVAMQGMQGMQGMPPPPPPQRSDEGFTKDELQSQLDEIGTSAGGDSERASLISSVIENFDIADADGDGRVSFQEAMALKQGSESSSTAAASPASSTTAATTAATAAEDTQPATRATDDAKLMLQIMELVHAYVGPESRKAEEGSISLEA